MSSKGFRPIQFHRCLGTPLLILLKEFKSYKDGKTEKSSVPGFSKREEWKSEVVHISFLSLSFFVLYHHHQCCNLGMHVTTFTMPFLAEQTENLRKVQRAWEFCNSQFSKRLLNSLYHNFCTLFSCFMQIPYPMSHMGVCTHLPSIHTSSMLPSSRAG